MPLRPFPSTFRIGCDIHHIPRIAAIVGQVNTNTGYYPFLRKLLTDREQTYFKAKHQSLGLKDEHSRSRITLYLAGRWAAKEACIKAVKPRKVTMREIEIWPDGNGETYAIILESGSGSGAGSGVKSSGDDRMGQATKMQHSEEWTTFTKPDPSLKAEVPSHDNVNGQTARVSISHDNEYAMAVAMAAYEPAADDVGGEAAARRSEGA